MVPGRLISVTGVSAGKTSAEVQSDANIGLSVNFCTFDILGELAFSSSFGCLESAEYHPWVKIIAFQQKEIEWIGELNRQGLRFITAIIMKILAKNKLEFMGYTIQKLQSRIQSGKQADIIESLLNNKEEMVRSTLFSP